VNNVLLLQICPVAELSHTQKDEFVSNNDRGSRIERSAIVVCVITVKAYTQLLLCQRKNGLKSDDTEDPCD
jgi:hypothetical protein